MGAIRNVHQEENALVDRDQESYTIFAVEGTSIVSHKTYILGVFFFWKLPMLTKNTNRRKYMVYGPYYNQTLSCFSYEPIVRVDSNLSSIQCVTNIKIVHMNIFETNFFWNRSFPCHHVCTNCSQIKPNFFVKSRTIPYFGFMGLNLVCHWTMYSVNVKFSCKIYFSLFYLYGWPHYNHV